MKKDVWRSEIDMVVKVAFGDVFLIIELRVCFRTSIRPKGRIFLNPAERPDDACLLEFCHSNRVAKVHLQPHSRVLTNNWFWEKMLRCLVEVILNATWGRGAWLTSTLVWWNILARKLQLRSMAHYSCMNKSPTADTLLGTYHWSNPNLIVEGWTSCSVELSKPSCNAGSYPGW